MAAITSAQAGNWSAAATWTGGVVPGNGDTVTLNHSVTVDVATIVGSSPATGGTPAIAWGTNNVVLTINADLTLRGDLIPHCDGSALDLVVQAAGVTVTFDASQAAAPSTTNYLTRLASAYPGWRWIFNGTATQPCTLQSDAAAGVTWFEKNGFYGGPRLHATYTKFLRIGNASNQASDILLGGASPEFYMESCVFDACGMWSANNGGSTTVQKLLNCVSKNSLGPTYIFNIGSVESATTPGELDNCYLDMEIVGAFGSMSVTNCVLVGNINATSDPATASFQYNLIGFGSSLSASGTIDQCYYKDFNTSDSNGHAVQISNGFSHDITNCVFETSYPTQGVGDMIGTGVSPASLLTYNIKNNILVPAPDGTSPGKLIVIGTTSTNIALVVEHNTVVSDGATGSEIGVVQFGENGTDGAPGQVTSLKSNLAWSRNSGNAVILSKMASTLQDEVAAANADYNATWNGMSGLDGLGYVSQDSNHIFSSGTPGVHDLVVSANPFVDRTRNFARWGASLGGAGTDSDTLDLMRKRLDWTDAGYAPSNGATVSALVAWVRDGFKVTDASLNNAGHDGATIGAMPYQASGTVWNVSLSDAASAGDSVSAQLSAATALSEAGSASDSLSALALYLSALVEAGVSVDTISAAAHAVAALAAAGAASDSLSAAWAGAAQLSASGAVADSVSAALTGLAPITEAGAAADTLSWSGGVYSVSLAESGAAADSIDAALIAVAQMADAGSAADVANAQADLISALSEAGDAVDSLSAYASMTVIITEAGSARDALAWISGAAPGAERILVLPHGGRIAVIAYQRRIAVDSNDSRITVN